MGRLASLLFISLLSLGPVSLADDSPLPICAADEFLAAFHKVVEHQVLVDESIATLEDLARVSGLMLEMRQELAQLPLCAEAIAIRRLLTQLGGDALARAALAIGGLPAADNPYLTRLPDDQARIEAPLAAMLAVERSEALPAGQRDLPACQAEDWTQLDEAAAALLELAIRTADAGDPAEALSAIESGLLWREDRLETLPECAESIDLLYAISAASTDSAANLAFTRGGLAAESNPFPPLLEASLAAIRRWRDLHSLKAASPLQPSERRFGRLSQLPPCAEAEPFAALADMQSEYADLIQDARDADSIADLADFANAQLAFRAARLAPLPHCAEALELRWQLAEALADAALKSAVAAGAPASLAPGQPAALAANDARAATSWARLDSLIGRADSAAPECDEVDHVFFFAYLAPEFWGLTNTALAIALPQEVPAFIDQSYAFRQLLWEYLPRCRGALEMGLLMRSVAADATAMLALELAGAPPWEIPYLPKVAGDIQQFFELASEFITACGNLDGASKTYYVVAQNIANIRACASTTCAIVNTAARGQRLDVIDDMSNWYEIVMPSCETAFIAGFLASETPPPR